MNEVVKENNQRAVIERDARQKLCPYYITYMG
jgi:hypothetical protein